MEEDQLLFTHDACLGGKLPHVSRDADPLERVWRCHVRFCAYHFMGLVILTWLPECDGIEAIERMGEQRQVIDLADRGCENTHYNALKLAIALVEEAIGQLQSMADAELAAKAPPP